MVQLQQGLQQVYCANAVKNGTLGIMEGNAMAYAAGATFNQVCSALDIAVRLPFPMSTDSFKNRRRAWP